jgi:hypothetical protein
MQTTILLEKLLEIERSVGHADQLALRTMVMDAQAEVLHVQREILAVLTEVRNMREVQESQLSSHGLEKRGVRRVAGMQILARQSA